MRHKIFFFRTAALSPFTLFSLFLPLLSSSLLFPPLPSSSLLFSLTQRNTPSQPPYHQTYPTLSSAQSIYHLRHEDDTVVSLGWQARHRGNTLLSNRWDRCHLLGGYRTSFPWTPVRQEREHCCQSVEGLEWGQVGYSRNGVIQLSLCEYNAITISQQGSLFLDCSHMLRPF